MTATTEKRFHESIRGRAFYDFAKEVAADLPGSWALDKYVPEGGWDGWDGRNYHNATLNGPDNQQIYMSLDADKVSVGGTPRRICCGPLHDKNQYAYNKLPASIGITWKKGAAHVAKEIARRYLPEYSAALADIAGTCAALTRRHSERAAVVKRLEMLGFEFDPRAVGNACEHTNTGKMWHQPDNSPLEYAEAHVSHDSVKLETGPMSPELALKIINILKRGE